MPNKSQSFRTIICLKFYVNQAGLDSAILKIPPRGTKVIYNVQNMGEMWNYLKIDFQMSNLSTIVVSYGKIQSLISCYDKSSEIQNLKNAHIGILTNYQKSAFLRSHFSSH